MAPAGDCKRGELVSLGVSPHVPQKKKVACLLSCSAYLRGLGGCPLAALGSKAAWRLASMTARISSVSSPVSSSGSRRGALAGGSLSSAASSSLDNPQGSPRPFQLFVVRRSAPADWRLRPRNALTVHAFLNVGGQGFFYGGTRFEQWLSSFFAAVSPGLPLPGNDAALAPDDYR